MAGPFGTLAGALALAILLVLPDRLFEHEAR